jgi:NADPH-dependent glutamate synthase beta subunit-like oxidoreductase
VVRGPRGHEKINIKVYNKFSDSEFHVPLVLPKRILGDASGRLRGIELSDMRLGEPDQGGGRRPILVEGSKHVKEVDTVIAAIGGRPNPLLLSSTKGIDVNRWGDILTDKETTATTREGVYVGGDIEGWGANVIKAMGDGRKAAKAMHEYLTAEPIRQAARNCLIVDLTCYLPRASGRFDSFDFQILSVSGSDQ